MSEIPSRSDTTDDEPALVAGALRALASPYAEALPDKFRLDRFVDLAGQAAAVIDRLRGMCLPDFEGEIACRLLRIYAPADGDGWICHWWALDEIDPKKQTFGQGPTLRDAVAQAIKNREVIGRG